MAEFIQHWRPSLSPLTSLIPFPLLEDWNPPSSISCNWASSYNKNTTIGLLFSVFCPFVAATVLRMIFTFHPGELDYMVYRCTSL